MADKYYAWSEIRNGGETEVQNDSQGHTFTVVTKRNVFPVGSEVTAKSVGVTDEEWDEWVARGAVRNYPYPEEADDTTSPAQVIIRKFMAGEGELDVNAMLALGLIQPEAVNPPASEGKELAAPKGA